MDREAKVRIGGDTTGLDRALGKSKANLNKWSKDVKSDVGGALRGAFSGLGQIAGFTGVGGLALAARETKLFNDRLVALQQTTGYSRAEILRMNAALQQTAATTGIQQSDLLQGIEKFQEVTGEAKKFSDALGDMAIVATATNAKMEDIAATAAAASTNLGVTGSEFQRMFDILAVQGDRGAVELKDMATMMPTLAAAASKFHTQGVQGVAEWGSVMQAVRKGTGTSSEALTQTVDLSSELLVRWRELEHAGVHVFSDKAHKQTRDFVDILDDIGKKIPRANLAKVMGSRKEALFAYDAFVKFRTEVAALATTEDKTGAIVQKNSVYMASSAAQFNLALASLHKTANDLMMGALPGLASAFQKVAASIKWLGDHKDIAIAAIAAWKLAPSALSGLGSANSPTARAAGALSGLAGAPAGAVPVYVTNMGAAGLGAGGAGLPGVAGAAVRAEGGLAKLQRGLDAAGKVLFAFGVGYAVGGVAADALGLNDSPAGDDVKSYRKYGIYDPDFARRGVEAQLGITSDQDSASSRAAFEGAQFKSGSAKRFNPDDKSIGEKETEAEYLYRKRAGIDAASSLASANAPIIAALEKIRAELAKQAPVTVNVDGHRSRDRRRSP